MTTLKMPEPSAFTYECGMELQFTYARWDKRGRVGWEEVRLYTASNLRDVLEQAATYADQMGMITAPELRAMINEIPE
jgi:hypothetical protein